ncbi:hypothetical protein [Natronosalvus halobius]|uniref:hypothetical protein n=1 Tax=Natronosalvus halobius TaxID=2953746 RepID=UPI0020A133BB|nr:hypothetical protein [Natronosalvus halobius]USZ71156.1 hypothetical protein NGM15_13855 [Natronosalvus halobius]
MTATRTVVCLVAVAVVGLLVAPAVTAAGGLGSLASESESATAENSSTMGEEMSTFMQASSVSTTHAVDDGMFEAAFQNASEERRAALIAERTDKHNSTIADLKEEYRTLQEQKDELHPGEYNVRMARLTVELASVDDSINRTERRAADAGVNTTAIQTLRANASELAGPEVAERAKQIAGIDPPRGPPDHAGGQNGSPGNGQEKASDAGQGAGPGEDADERNGEEKGQDNGAPDDPGAGSGDESPPDTPDKRADEESVPDEGVTTDESTTDESTTDDSGESQDTNETDD